MKKLNLRISSFLLIVVLAATPWIYTYGVAEPVAVKKMCTTSSNPDNNLGGCHTDTYGDDCDPGAQGPACNGSVLVPS